MSDFIILFRGGIFGRDYAQLRLDAPPSLRAEMGAAGWKALIHG